jgi:hypothetical protein
MNKAVETALKYIGQTEKPHNSGFTQIDFERKMESVGFNKGHAWCAYFSELVFKEAYPDKKKEFDKLFNASAVKTFGNFKDAGYLVNDLPQEGNLVIWQTQKDGEPQWTGHAGIVVSVEPEPDHWKFESVEGNTNDGGGREGYIVARKKRKVLKDVPDGLKVLGFVQI